jgi:D-arginine dehydrogenase
LAAKVSGAAGAWADQMGEMVGARFIGRVPKRPTAIIVDAPNGIKITDLPVIDLAGSDAHMKPSQQVVGVSWGYNPDRTPRCLAR